MTNRTLWQIKSRSDNSRTYLNKQNLTTRRGSTAGYLVKAQDLEWDRLPVTRAAPATPANVKALRLDYAVHSTICLIANMPYNTTNSGRLA
jgi:hypothetical protein